MSGLFVDVGENTSILDHIKLTFVYDDIAVAGSKNLPRLASEGEVLTKITSIMFGFFFLSKYDIKQIMGMSIL